MRSACTRDAVEPRLSGMHTRAQRFLHAGSRPACRCAARRVGRRAFARQCVLSLQEGAQATLLLAQAKGPASVQLVLSTDGLRLQWTPASGSTEEGFVRTTDIRSVVYAAADPTAPTPHPDEAARPAYARFSIVTPQATYHFASACLARRTGGAPRAHRLCSAPRLTDPLGASRALPQSPTR